MNTVESPKGSVYSKIHITFTDENTPDKNVNKINLKKVKETDVVSRKSESKSLMDLNNKHVLKALDIELSKISESKQDDDSVFHNSS